MAIFGPKVRQAPQTLVRPGLRSVFEPAIDEEEQMRLAEAGYAGSGLGHLIAPQQQAQSQQVFPPSKDIEAAIISSNESPDDILTVDDYLNRLNEESLPPVAVGTPAAPAGERPIPGPFLPAQPPAPITLPSEGVFTNPLTQRIQNIVAPMSDNRPPVLEAKDVFGLHPEQVAALEKEIQGKYETDRAANMAGTEMRGKEALAQEELGIQRGGLDVEKQKLAAMMLPKVDKGQWLDLGGGSHLNTATWQLVRPEDVGVQQQGTMKTRQYEVVDREGNRKFVVVPDQPGQYPAGVDPSVLAQKSDSDLSSSEVDAVFRLSGMRPNETSGKIEASDEQYKAALDTLELLHAHEITKAQVPSTYKVMLGGMRQTGVEVIGFRENPKDPTRPIIVVMGPDKKIINVPPTDPDYDAILNPNGAGGS
jgi:hypothetical protein